MKSLYKLTCSTGLNKNYGRTLNLHVPPHTQMGKKFRKIFKVTEICLSWKSTFKILFKKNLPGDNRRDINITPWRHTYFSLSQQTDFAHVSATRMDYFSLSQQTHFEHVSATRMANFSLSEHNNFEHASVSFSHARQSAANRCRKKKETFKWIKITEIRGRFSRVGNLRTASE